MSHGGCVGKSHLICNFHKCLEAIVNSLLNDQGATIPIHANVHFGGKALCHVVFRVAYDMGECLSSDKMCSHFLVIQMSMTEPVL